MSAPVAAARISSAADIVSIQATSAPPSFRPSASSPNDSTAELSVSAPSGSNSSPVGPTEPATTIGRGDASATSQAISAARLASSYDAALGLVQLEAMAVAAEGVGEDDVGAGIDELLMQRAHLVGLIDVPELRRVACTEPAFEVVGARRPVGQQRAAGGQQFRKRSSHGGSKATAASATVQVTGVSAG